MVSFPAQVRHRQRALPPQQVLQPNRPQLPMPLLQQRADEVVAQVAVPPHQLRMLQPLLQLLPPLTHRPPVVVAAAAHRAARLVQT